MRCPPNSNIYSPILDTKETIKLKNETTIQLSFRIQKKNNVQKHNRNKTALIKIQFTHTHRENRETKKDGNEQQQ